MNNNINSVVDNSCISSSTTRNNLVQHDYENEQEDDQEQKDVDHDEQQDEYKNDEIGFAPDLHGSARQPYDNTGLDDLHGQAQRLGLLTSNNFMFLM